MKHSTKINGFSLIELMVTLAILAVITTIAIPAYTGYVKAAKMSEAKNNLAALRLAEEEYFLENNRYFTGANFSELESTSGRLWIRTKGSSATALFDYAVISSSPTSTWKATAKGNVSGTSVYNETVEASKD